MSEIKGFKSTLDKMYEIQKKKNTDYSGEADPFKSFKVCHSLGIATVEQGMLVRITDKISRLSTLLDKKETAIDDERIEDTLIDLANYAVIMKCWLEAKK